MQEEIRRQVPKFAKIRRLRDHLSKQQKDDFDAVLVISGQEGVGKSTLGIEIAHFMQEKNGFKFDYERNMAYNAAEAFLKMKNLNRFETLLLDEGMRLAWRRQWFDAEQRRLARLFSQIRSRNLCLIICIPAFTHLDTYYREHRVQYWVHVVARGYGIYFVPENLATARDKWGIDQAQKILNKQKGRTVTSFDDVETKIKKHRIIPSFYDWFKFPPLRPDEYEKYRVISDKRKLEETEDDDETDTRHFRMIREANKKLKNDPYNLTQKERAAFFGAYIRTVQRWDAKTAIDEE